jgi:hypothetical protein
MTKVLRVNFFKIKLNDKPGALLEVMQELKAKGIGLACLWGYAKPDGNADLIIVPKNPDKIKILWKPPVRETEEGTGFFIKGADRTGVLVKTLEALANAGINLKAMNAIAAAGNYGSVIWVDAADIEKAAQVLGAK